MPTNTTQVGPTGSAENASFDPSTGDPRCTGYPGEWVPDREQRAVPGDMLALCRACGGRQACLLVALRGHEVGYWAGTTTKDRAAMTRLGQTSTDTADWLQELANPVPKHLPGRASTGWYRRGCRCGGCRAHNAGQRARERVSTR